MPPASLRNEHPLYMEFKENAPRLGSRVDTPEGEGRVIGYNVPGDTVTVKVGSRRCACPSASVCSPRKQHDATYNPTSDEDVT